MPPKYTAQEKFPVIIFFYGIDTLVEKIINRGMF